MLMHAEPRHLERTATIHRPSVVLLLGVLSAFSVSLGRAAPPLRLVQSIPLDRVEGRIDHMAADPQGRRLFVAALGNNTVEVIDLRAGKRILSLGGFHDPQGVCFLSDRNRLYVTSREGCAILDGASLEGARQEWIAKEADNIRYDAASKRIYVGFDRALGVLDVASGKSLDPIPLTGHPESFQLESAGPLVYVNLPDPGKVVVWNRAAGRIAAVWRLGRYGENFPMALDEAEHLLFVACRHPAAVLALDTRSGRRTASIPIAGDADDLFYDASRRRLYVACGAGFVDVLKWAPGRITKQASIRTSSGARTALYVPELGGLYVAVPHRGRQRAEIRVFEAAP
jgi:DNA-binding beta-propeller fold protein YncE